MGILNLLRKKEIPRPFCSAVIVAAGSSERMGVDKMAIDLGGIPLLACTLRAIEECTCIDEIIVVTRSEKIVDVSCLCKDYNISKATKILCGGTTRLESVFAGLMETDERARYIAVHDGARPFVTPEIVEETLQAAIQHLAAAPAVPVKDTIKLAEDGVVIQTPDRNKTVAVQTPQIFVTEIIKAALTDALEREISFTDDCSAVEALGVKIHLTKGSEENIKITTPIDVGLAEVIVRSRDLRG